jgi:hypothetical protein
VKRITCLAVVVFLFSFLTGCGGGGRSTPPPPPTVTLSASQSSVIIGGSATLTWFTANVISCTASGDWSGTKALSGSESVTPSSAGSKTYKLTCSGAGGTASASATVTVAVPPPASVSPPSAVLAANQPQQFEALATDGTAIDNRGIVWSVNGVVGGSQSTGTIASDGLYVPPSAIAGVEQATITATSAADSTKSASAAVTLVFLWAQFYAPQGGTSSATAVALNSDQGRLVVATGSSIPNSSDTTSDFLLFDAGTGESKDVWTNSPAPAHVNALTLGPDGNVYAVGYTGGDSNLDAHAAWVLKIAVGDTLQVSTLTEFQLEGQRTEGRAINFDSSGEIYLAVRSNYQVCGLGPLNYCSGDWVVILDAAGNILSEFYVGNAPNWAFSPVTSITSLLLVSDHVWTTGDTSFQDQNGNYQVAGYIDKHSLAGDLLAGPDLMLPMYNPKLLYEGADGSVIVAVTLMRPTVGNSLVGAQGFSTDLSIPTATVGWDGDDRGAVSVNKEMGGLL